MAKFQVTVDPDLEAIIPRYMELCMKDLANLEQSIESGDSENIRMLGHKLKGTGSSYGFHKLTELGAAIEIAGKTSDFGEAGKLTAEMRSYLENVEITYDRQG